MPVLLFVQIGDARPKCEGRAHNRWGVEAHSRHNLGGTDYSGSARMTSAMASADRWWLVECENAEAGRAIITHDALLHTSIGKAFAAVGPVVKSRDPNKVSEPVQGRILAHGGKR